MTNAEAWFNKSHIRKVYACLAVTCHLHFWQNDRDFLRATVVTRGWNGYRIRVSTESRPWRRKFSRRSSRDSNPRPFNHESGALTTELSPPRMFTTCLRFWFLNTWVISASDCRLVAAVMASVYIVCVFKS